MSAFGQVTKVNYGIKYNSTTCLFDCYMKVIEGQTNSDRDRVQFNSQLSVVVPTGSEVRLETSHAPFINNIKERGTKVAPWSISNFAFAPESSSEVDVYGITPKTYPVAAYHDLVEGDEVVLFSLSISPIVDCAKDVRIFDLSKDPSSSAKGMYGSDYRNGFTIGGAEQKFGQFESTITPLNDFVKDFDIVYGKTTEITYSLNSDLSQCQKDLTYAWKAPNGRTLGTSSKAPSAIFTNTQNSGQYSLEVSDAFGCKEIIEFAPISSNTQANVNTNNGSVFGSAGSVNGGGQIATDEFNLSIFPNPATDLVNINIQAPKSDDLIIGTIYDLSGKVIKSNIFNLKGNGFEQNVRVPLDLTSGIYNIGVSSGSERLGTYKLIVIE